MASSLPPHPDYPALPVQGTGMVPDSGCQGCPLAQTGGHKTCSEFRMENDPAVMAENRISMKQVRELQAAISRRAFDAMGIVGSPSSGVYRWNASRQFNFCIFSVWNVTDIDGDTLTLEVLDPLTDDARAITLSFWRERDPILHMFWVTGFYSLTSVMPGDMLEFEMPSRASNMQSKILQVISCDATTIEVKLDKTLPHGDSYFPQYDQFGDPIPDPDNPKARIYHYGREEEQWTYIINPKWFFGRRVTKTINAADLDSDGIWILENGVICPPSSFDSLHPKFVIEGFNVSDGWQVINDTNRLHIKPTESSYALKTTNPDGSIRNDPATDLTETYTRFRATYYAKADANDPMCIIVGHDRCFYSRVDYTDSVGNYDTDSGVGVSDDGEHVYCAKRVYEEYEYVDDYDRINQQAGQDGIPDRVDVTLHHPANLDLFPTSGATAGQCIQFGYCEHYENSLDHAGDRAAPFSIDYMRWLPELWFACDARLQQQYVLSQNYILERMQHPSIMWLIGYYGGLISPPGFNAKTSPLGTETWSVVKPETVIDQDGEFLRPITGLERGYLVEYDAGPPPEWSVDPDRPGVLPDNVSDYTTMRDPFDPSLTVQDDLLEYVGAQVTRDDLTIKTSGLSRISAALGEEDIVCPNFDLGITTLQQNFRSTFQRAEPHVGGDGVLTILPYRQDAKSELSLGSRTLYSITPLGGGRYQIDLDNTEHRFSRFDSGTDELGDSYNRIFTVMAGGGPVVLPYEHQALNSFEGEKDTGSRRVGAMPLDCVEIDGDRFVIESVHPHGGSEASGWGDKQETLTGGIGGFAELPVGNGPEGNPLQPLEIVGVVRVSDSQAFASVNTEDKPALGDEEFWYDGGNRVYFSHLNDGDYLEINYNDSEGTPQTPVYFTVDEHFVVDTTYAWTQYSAAIAKSVHAGGVPLSIVGAAPTPGEVWVQNVSGVVRLTFNIAQASLDWRLIMRFSDPADPPQDDWAVGGNYTTFGKKRDRIIIRADVHNSTDALAGKSLTGEAVDFYRSATVFLPQTDLVVEWTSYESNNWQALSLSDYMPNAASGRVVIDSDALTAIALAASNNVCFRVRDVQMVDHRGFVPASILNKTAAVVEEMEWLLQSMGSGFGVFNIDQYASQVYSDGNLAWNPAQGACVVSPDGNIARGPSFAAPNVFYRDMADDRSEVWLRVQSTSFGPPQAIQRLPDGVEIVEAWAEINSTGLTRSYTYQTQTLYDCDGNVVTPGINPGGIPDTSTMNPEFQVIKFTSPEDYTVIGSISTPEPGRCVVNVTSLLQTMYASRKDGNYGYGIIYTPPGTGPGNDVAQFLKKGGLRSEDLCGPVMPCYPDGGSVNRWYEYEYLVLEWGSITFGQIAIRIDYKGKDKLIPLQPRHPAFIDL